MAEMKKTPRGRVNEFRRLLAKVRDEGYTYTQIAEEMDISTSTAQNWCKGFSSPTDERVIALTPVARDMLS